VQAAPNGQSAVEEHDETSSQRKAVVRQTGSPPTAQKQPTGQSGAQLWPQLSFFLLLRGCRLGEAKQRRAQCQTDAASGAVQAGETIELVAPALHGDLRSRGPAFVDDRRLAVHHGGDIRRTTHFGGDIETLSSTGRPLGDNGPAEYQ
jgi:hypothetical protein